MVDNGTAFQTDTHPVSLNVDSNSSEAGDLNIVDGTCQAAPVVAKKYIYLTLKEKKSVVEVAKQLGVRKAAKKLKVPSASINDWIKINFDDEERSEWGHLPKGGCPIVYESAIEMRIVEWLRERRDSQLPVTVESICSFARELVKGNTRGTVQEAATKFKASSGWAEKFLSRHNLELCPKTSMILSVPDKSEQEHTDYSEKGQESEFGVTVQRIANPNVMMDENSRDSEKSRSVKSRSSSRREENDQEDSQMGSKSDEDIYDEDGEIVTKQLRKLSFANPGKFMEDFDPERSNRELRKVNRRIYSENIKKNQLYDESGRFIENCEDRCDCLEVDCPGCHFPCPKCGSEKCGAECRCARKWFYELVEVEGTDIVIKWPG